MAQIEGEIVIQRPIGEVFDFVADERNEPQYNPQMTSIEKVSGGDIGLGTQFRAEVMSGGRPLPMVIEFTTFKRPSQIASRSIMSGMVIQGQLTFESVGESSTRMRWGWDLKPSGALWLLTPVMVFIGKRQERGIWTSLKRCLEARALQVTRNTLAPSTISDSCVTPTGEDSMDGRIRRIDFGVNCYLIDVEGGYVLIDTSFPSKRDKLDAELAAAGCGPDDLRLIVLTHGDVDHAGNCAHLRSTLHAPVAIHRQDAEMVRSGDMGAGRKDKPDRHTIAFRFLTWSSELLNKITGTGAGFEVFEPDVLLEDGQDLSVYGFDARVVHLPGHSSGSIGILTGDGDLFCGDLLVNVLGPSLHYYIDNLAQANESIRKLSELGVGTVYPGHGKPFPLSKLSIQGR